MNKPLQAVTAAALLLGSAQATDLRIYQGFAEVRTPITASGNSYTVDLSDNVWGGIVPGSLDIEGLKYTSAVQRRQSSWLTGLEGQQVTLREDGKEQTVTLVRAADLLIKDAAGQYRTVRFDQLAFPKLPPVNAQNPTQNLTYSLVGAGQGTLTYLTRQISWTPRYTLRASGSAATLTAQADIRNDSEQSYNVVTTELFSGDVNLEDMRFGDYRFASQAAAPAPVVMVDAGNAAPKINSLNTLNGLYRYGLSSTFTLPASSTYTLPFTAPKLTTFERYAGLNTYFSPQKQQGTLSRFYRLKADQNLPGGQLTVREDGRISGQTTVQATAKGDEIEFSLGRDPDVKYTRTVDTLKTLKNGGSYKVTYTFESNKDQPVRAEVSEQVGGRRVQVDGLNKNDQGSYEFRLDVPAHGKASKSFTVTVDNS